VSYEKALVLAIKAHDGQRRATGEPYVIHPVSVAARVGAFLSRSFVSVDPLTAKIVAVLHDVLEDTDVPSCDLEEKFGAPVTRAVELLTRPPKEYRTQSYQEWIETLVGTRNWLAIAVKYADVEDNLSTVDDVPSKASLRPRYEKALETLRSALMS